MTITEAWCRTYTRLLPTEEAECRQREIASHVHEALEHGVSRSRLMREAGLGMPADLLWSAAVRRRAGLPALWLIPLIDASVGAIVGGALILLTLLWASLPTGEESGWPARALAYGALALASSGHAVAIVTWLRR
ncbi:MAG: hypothetical protein JJD92_07500 [Frankiaceae bacterium]|nr:hypothetical protein [Frankiaceae bacterium]